MLFLNLLAYFQKMSIPPFSWSIFLGCFKHKLLGYNTILLLSTVYLENEGSAFLSETFIQIYQTTLYLNEEVLGNREALRVTVYSNFWRQPIYVCNIKSLRNSSRGGTIFTFLPPFPPRTTSITLGTTSGITVEKLQEQQPVYLPTMSSEPISLARSSKTSAELSRISAKIFTSCSPATKMQTATNVTQFITYMSCKLKFPTQSFYSQQGGSCKNWYVALGTKWFFLWIVLLSTYRFISKLSETSTT